MTFRRLLRNQNGNTTVEFAFIVPVFLTIFVGVFEFGSYLWVRNTVQFAAEEAARFAMANIDATTAQVSTRARDRMASLDATKVSVQVQQVADGGTTFIVVSTSYTRAAGFLSDLMPVDLTTATGQARMPLVQ